MKNNFFIKILLILFALGSVFFILSYINYTQIPILAESKMCECDQASKDPYSKPLIYTYGRFKGQCVSNCFHRSTQFVISETLKNKRNEIQIANVFHNNKFWRATVDVDSLKTSEIIFEKFAWNINHVSIRFVFSKPISLESQDLLLGPKKTKLMDSSLVFSPEAALPKNKIYNLVDGFMGRYGFIYKAYSFETYRKIAKQLDHPSKILPLNLDSKESQALFVASFLKANERPLQTYQLVFNNCATASIDLILDSKKLLLSKGWDVWDIIDPLRGIPSDIYLGTLRSLYWWNLIDDRLTEEQSEPSKS